VPGTGTPPPLADSLLSALRNHGLPRYARLFIAKVWFPASASQRTGHGIQWTLRAAV